jgi:hypothetical protein
MVGVRPQSPAAGWKQSPRTPRRLGVERLTAALEQAVVGGVLDQRVLEAVGRLRSIALEEQNIGLGEPLQRRLQRALVEASHGLEQRIGESPAQHGADLRGLTRSADPIEPCGERLLQDSTIGRRLDFDPLG